MTLDAMHWVWAHSRSSGNPRLVLLAVADKVQDTHCVTRIGTTELRARLGGVSKSVVVRAIDKVLASGELVMVEEARGSRAAVYQLPHAVAHKRLAPGATGPDSPPVAAPQGYRIETPDLFGGSQIETGTRMRGVAIQDRGGTGSRPLAVPIQAPTTNPLLPGVKAS